MTVTVPLLSTPVADPSNTVTFAENAARNFLEVNPVFTAANLQNIENNTLNANVNTKSAAADASAAAAAVSAAAAAATSTAPNWVSGTTYAVGNVRRSLVDGLPYKRITVGAGTTDPLNDPDNWLLDFLQIDSGLPNLKPTLLLDPANSGVVDSRIVCTRASTATYFDKFGVMKIAPANTLRIDHDPVTGECFGYLLEYASTNLIANSQDLSSSAWVGCDRTLAAEVFRGLAPFYEVTRTTTSDSVVSNVSTVLPGAVLTLTVALLSGTSTYALVGVIGEFNEGSGTFWGLPEDCSHEVLEGPGVISSYDATTGGLTTVSALSASIPTVVRITRKFNTGQTARVWMSPGQDPSMPIGTSAKFARVQLEPKTENTSYIPTSGVAVTRATEVASISGTAFSDFFNQTEGTCVVMARWLGSPISSVYPVMFKSSAYDFFGVYQVGAYFAKDLVTQASLVGPQKPNGELSVATFSYKRDQFMLSMNGAASAIDTAGEVPIANTLVLRDQDTGAIDGVCIASIAYYPRAVSASELQALSRN